MSMVRKRLGGLAAGSKQRFDAIYQADIGINNRRLLQLGLGFALAVAVARSGR